MTNEVLKTVSMVSTIADTHGNAGLRTAILRVLAIVAGTYYVFCGIYLFENRSEMSATGTITYFGAYAGQLSIGVILVGIGLGAWRIVLNAKTR